MLEHFVTIRFPSRTEKTWLCTFFVLWNLDWKSEFTVKQMMEKEVPLHRLFPYHCADFTFGVAKECGPCRKRPKSPKSPYYMHSRRSCQRSQQLSPPRSLSCTLQLFLCLARAKYQMTDVSVPAAQRGQVCDSCPTILKH